MKKIILTIILNTALFTYAQVINIPDSVFKNYLLQASPGVYHAQDINNNNITIDTNANGQIEVNEALQVYYLYPINAGINDMTGIEYFTNLVWLGAGGNYFTSINVNTIPNLGIFGFQNNPNLTSVYLKNGSSLNYNSVYLPCGSFTNCPNLSYICADEAEIPALQSFLTNCGYNLANITIDSNCALGEHSFNKALVQVYPNPSNSGVFSVALPEVSKGNVLVYNALGQRVYSNTFAGQNFVIEVSFLPKGTYILKLTNDKNEVFTEKLVRE